MQHIWTYPAHVVRVIDGDSVVVDIELGYGVWLHKQHLRLYGIDAPERNRIATRKEGEKSRDFLIDMLNDTDPIWIHSIGKDKYGRWLTDIYPTATSGFTYNAAMIRGEHAQHYYGKKRDRIGIFVMSGTGETDFPDAFDLIMESMEVLRAERTYLLNEISYIARSKLFDYWNKGEEVPEYSIMVEQSEGKELKLFIKRFS